MTDQETGAESGAAGEPAEAPAAAKPAPPPRVLPNQEEIAAWAEGADLPSLDNLFNLLNVKRFDGLVMQIRKEELLPQHWQVISKHQPPPDEQFDRLPEVARLAQDSSDPEAARRRVESLRLAWRELRGKRPALWSVSDLFAALRRIIDKKREVSFHDLFSAARDVWRGLELPQGREQIEVLWACLDFVRSKTRT